ncbi:hypothetical protein [Methylovulum psychrotolerans]|uniref:Uncharacterized protein n=1 Tax=Methylovulum psychrotolerans TaxID=1704499 RepID=A0A2S5CFK7_9GAMM|nr:hypothetical protein [Methylovulum psychrotolerans]POZ49593.1 hypothetical protein AADEFJLK_04637 [Methylovulum psychrotolerans]
MIKPAEAFKNWAGGFTDLNAAMGFAANGGIPVTAVTSAGKISKVRMEHIWVEAALDFIPSRGAKNKAADSWVEMDPSYKQYTYKKGLDAVAISGLDPNQLAQSFTASGTVNDAEGWATGFDPTILQNAQSQAQQKLQAYIQANLSNPTVGDIIGGRSIIAENYPILMGGLSVPVVLTGAHYDKLPASLQQQISYSFAQDIQGAMLNPTTLPFAQANNQKLTLSFRPATDADSQALQSLLPQGDLTSLSQLPQSIPSYLISVVPELKLNGQTLKTGSPLRLGEELPLTTAVSFAGRGQTLAPRTYYAVAGSYLAVNAYAGSVSPQTLKATQAQLQHTQSVLQSADTSQIAALNREDLLGDLFHAGGLGYYAQLTALSRLMGLQNGAHYTLAAGTGTFGYEPNVSYFFGFPRSIKPGGIALDIPLVSVTASDDGDAAHKKQYTLQTGILSSALESAVPEQLFTNAQNPGEAISAVKALQKASAAGQRIYHITPATLANIHHDADTMADIRNALNAGKEVITHTDNVSVPGWTGAGYIITDADTGAGAGAYKIAGGGNGGFITFLDDNAGIIGLLAAMIGVIPITAGLLPFLVPLLSFVIAASLFTVGLMLFIESLDGGSCDQGALLTYISLVLASVVLGVFFGSLGVVAWVLWFTGFLADGAIRSVFSNPAICRR